MATRLKVLVTGGAGYIGSVVVEQLLAAGHAVVVFDDLRRGHRPAVSPGAQFVAGDVADRTALDRALRGSQIDSVMHFAADIEAGESMRQPERFFRNNTANALTLLEAVLANEVPRFVFSSTAALYGDPQRTPIEETDSLQPTNAYGESKLMVERMLDWLHRRRGISYASLRYFNAAGATETFGEDHRPESHLVPLVLQAALGKRNEVAIYGTDYPTPDGTCIRDYIHVIDLAAAHLLALDALAASGAPRQLIYNLGNGRGFSVREVVAVARRVTGCAIPTIDAPRRPGDPAVLVASSEKIKRELQWRPQFPELETIVGSAWEWMRRHPEGYSDV